MLCCHVTQCVVLALVGASFGFIPQKEIQQANRQIKKANVGDKLTYGCEYYPIDYELIASQ